MIKTLPKKLTTKTGLGGRKPGMGSSLGSRLEPNSLKADLSNFEKRSTAYGMQRKVERTCSIKPVRTPSCAVARYQVRIEIWFPLALKLVTQLR